jgi:putative peptide zinc metalloprotease protein
LNPIFRFDGYWMIADALGIHNLSQQPSRLLGHLWKKIRGRPPKPLPWKPWVTAFLSLYSVLSFAIWGLFIWFVLPFFAERIVTYPEKLMAFLHGLVAGDGGPTMDFVVSTYAFLLAVLILGRMARSWLLRLWGFFKSKLGSLTGTDPVPREADSA